MADEPDIAFIGRQLERVLTRLGELDRKMTQQFAMLHQDVRMIRAGLHDIGDTRVTTGEITSLHEDVNRVMADVAEVRVRLETLESRHD
jgi:ubiquinone biosynthesis protein UbiJ